MKYSFLKLLLSLFVKKTLKVNITCRFSNTTYMDLSSQAIILLVQTVVAISEQGIGTCWNIKDKCSSHCLEDSFRGSGFQTGLPVLPFWALLKCFLLPLTHCTANWHWRCTNLCQLCSSEEQNVNKTVKHRLHKSTGFAGVPYICFPSFCSRLKLLLKDLGLF